MPTPEDPERRSPLCGLLTEATAVELPAQLAAYLARPVAPPAPRLRLVVDNTAAAPAAPAGPGEAA